MNLRPPGYERVKLEVPQILPRLPRLDALRRAGVLRLFASPTVCRILLLLHLQPRFGGHSAGQKRLSKTEWKEVEMQDLTYTSRGPRRRRNSDRWEAVLSHTDPVTGEVVRTFHTVEGKTRRQAERARDALILELVRAGNGLVNCNRLDHVADLTDHIVPCAAQTMEFLEAAKD